jgi:hypothetical protein
MMVSEGEMAKAFGLWGNQSLVGGGLVDALLSYHSKGDEEGASRGSGLGVFVAFKSEESLEKARQKRQARSEPDASAFRLTERDG